MGKRVKLTEDDIEEIEFIVYDFITKLNLTDVQAYNYFKLEMMDFVTHYLEDLDWFDWRQYSEISDVISIILIEYIEDDDFLMEDGFIEPDLNIFSLN